MSKVRVLLQTQDRLPPAILARQVGTLWWRKNCHGAETLNSIPGVEGADVREDYSTLKYHGQQGTLPHVGPNSWLRDVVKKADAGKHVRGGWRFLDFDYFVPSSPDRQAGKRRRCAAKVTDPQTAKLVPCGRMQVGVNPDDNGVPQAFMPHEGDCTPIKQSTGRPRNYGRR